MPPQSPPPIPLSFTTRRTAILSSLSTPPSLYTDLSPKGTVDTAIKHLLDRINALEGVVTTSSCAGRVSVFLEGRKGKERVRNTRGGNGKCRSRKGGDGDGDGDGDDGEDMGERGQKKPQIHVPGGKGIGGRWLFISHEPLSKKDDGYTTTQKFGLQSMPESPPHHPIISDDKSPNQLRFARFQFEPMILHIMTASLHHAQPILAAAINAGFRESGVQSLKNLSDGNAFPMVAVRSAGLRVESLVGVCYDRGGGDGGDGEGASHHEVLDEDEERDSMEDGDDEEKETVWSIVTDTYCDILQQLANERFEANSERVRRFEDELFKSRGGMCGGEWEDGVKRRERKRGEGLKRRDGLRGGTVGGYGDGDGDGGGDGDGDGHGDVGNGMLVGLCANVVTDGS